MRLPQCVPIRHDAPPGVADALGIFLIVATFIAPLPQFFVLARTRSSAGVAVATPAIQLSYGVLGLCTTVATKWRTLETCAHSAACTLQLTDALQQFVSACTLVALLLLVVSLPPHRTRAHGALAGSTVLLLAAAVVAICAVSAAAPCSAASLSFAQATSAAASLGAIVAFLPQIYETWRTRGRGSISYLSYFIQGLGCMVVMINMVVNNHDPWTVWMPGFVAGLGQLTIVVLGLGFLCRDRGRPLVAVADGGASLLQ